MAKKEKVIIGSRGSDLALWQAHHVQAKLKKIGVSSEIKIIKTQGDQIQNIGFDKMQGKGFFTKEIEDALLKKEIDLAVHSHKDLPTESPKGLIIAAVSEREDPSDVLLINKDFVDKTQKYSLKKGASVGTSSARRKALMLAFRDDVKLKDLRGNVPTRIEKLRKKEYNAILLASAGVERLELDLSEFHIEKLSPKEFVSAPAQGVLALQIRKADKALFDTLQKIHRADVQEAIYVEREILHLFEGGCQMPVGVYCETDTDLDEQKVFRAWLAKAKAWDKPIVQLYAEGNKADKVIKQLVEKATTVKPCEVYLTRNKRASDYFDNALTRLKFKTHFQSLIEMRLIVVKEWPAAEWIFFSSKNAVKYFFLQKPKLSPGVKFGVISKSTGEELRRYGHTPTFLGQSIDTSNVSRQFANLAGNSKVLFPQAKGSMKSIQSLMPKKGNIINLVVYETLKFPDAKIPKADIVVFTSPSNVDAYFERATITDKQRCVAMGDATAFALAKHGVKKCVKPASFDDTGLIQAVLMS